jgi:hypothetical protein
LAAEFIKCVSADEVRIRLSSGRRHSALLVDATAQSFDRDLVDAASARSTPVIVIRDSRGPVFADSDLGIAASLAHGFSRADLEELLGACCQKVGRGAELGTSDGDEPGSAWMGDLYTVCGPGGTGSSTVAMALAQGLAAEARLGTGVLLADLARRADQGMLHDAGDVGPGFQELVEGHRLGRLSRDEIIRTAFDVPRRGYALLLGLRQPDHWAALRPRAVDAALGGLRRTYPVVVADVSGDVEGEAEGGSIEVEERNYVARASMLSSTVVVVVGAPGMKGTHSLAQQVRTMVRIGVPERRMVALINRSPRNPRSRAESARAFSILLTGAGISVPGPTHIPERKIEDVIRDGGRLPAAIVDPVTRAAGAAALRGADDPPVQHLPVRIAPGSIGTWSSSEEG